MKKMMLILADDKEEVILFAQQELCRYLKRAGVTAEYSKTGGRDAGLCHYFNVLELKSDPKLFKLQDSSWDDAYQIEFKNGGGAIIGSNARSVLLGAYRYLRELGFAFLRPDCDAERIPEKLGMHDMMIHEQAASRYRGLCIEGAVSFGNVLSLIDWLPKMGFNAYFTQFLIPYEFFKTWYSHSNNPDYPSEQVPSPEQVDLFVKNTLVPQLKKRGLIWQAAGHGFTAEAISVPGLGWDPYPQEGIPKEKKHYVAKTEKKRELFHGIPLNTNLCYSNKEVQVSLIETVLSYLKENPQVDMLHFWLADEGNNSCECINCRKKLPSEWYVELLERLDEKVCEEGYQIKLVFLAYYDLLWPPRRQLSRLKNPSHFVFLFAPITRSYAKALTYKAPGEIPAFERNHYVFPKKTEENLDFLFAWKKVFSGDSFLYDYHYMWSLFRDWGDYYLAKVLWEDIRNLSSLGLNGYISCQQTRVFAPTGFGMYVMGQTLWNQHLTFEELTETYFRLMFGEDGSYIQEYCERLSALSYRDQPENDGPGRDEEAADKLEAALKLIEDTRGRMKQSHLKSKAEGRDSTAWRYLNYSAHAAWLYLTTMRYRRRGEEDQVLPAYEALRKFLREAEEQWQEGFDLYWFLKDRDKVFAEKKE